MKITESQLRQIIVEEISSLFEADKNLTVSPTSAIVQPGIEKSSQDEVTQLATKLKTLIKKEDASGVDMTKLASALRDINYGGKLDTNEKAALGMAFVELINTKDTNSVQTIMNLIKKI